jgi:hypothetical protein
LRCPSNFQSTCPNLYPPILIKEKFQWRSGSLAIAVGMKATGGLAVMRLSRGCLRKRGVLKPSGVKAGATVEA